jgi:hypothetical protein
MGGTNTDTRFRGLGRSRIAARGQRTPSALPLLAPTAVQYPPDAVHALRCGAAMSFPTRPIGRTDVLATTLGVGTGPLRRPPIADAIAHVPGSGGVGALPIPDSVRGVIDARRSDSTAMATAT